MNSKRKHQNTFLKKSWTLRLIPSNSHKSLVFRLKPMHLLVLALVLCGFFMFIGKGYAERLRTVEQRITVLNDANEQQKLYIDKLRAEKEQMAGLVEKQNLELGDKLRDIEQKSCEVGKIVGLKVKPESSKKESVKRRQLKANRGTLVYKNMENQANALHRQINLSEKQVKIIEKKAIAYYDEMKRRERILNALPSLWPSSGIVTSPFGYRLHPIYGSVKFHSGIDIAAPYGEPIYAAAAGNVIQSSYESGYGNCVRLNHSNGYSTLYAHCSELFVSPGQWVNKGDLIANIGSTGSSTGSHLHYEVLDHGMPTDPEPYLKISARKFKNENQAYVR